MVINMKLTRVYIDNFKMFDNFSIDLPAYEGMDLIIGENNTGKTSFFDIINRILGYNSYLYRIYFDEDEFDISKKITCQFTFEDFSADEQTQFHDCIYNFDNKLFLTISFEYFWDDQKRRYDFSLNYVDPHRDLIIKDMYQSSKEYFSFFYIPPIRNIDIELNLNKQGDLKRIINRFAPFTISNIKKLRKSMINSLDIVSKDFTEIYDISNSRIASRLLALIGILQDHLIILTGENLNENQIKNYVIRFKDLIKYLLSQIIILAKEETHDRFKERIDAFLKNIEIYKTKILLSKKSNELKEYLHQFKELADIELNLKQILSKVLPAINLNLDFLGESEIKVLKNLFFKVDEFPVEIQGDGYKNVFLLGLKLFLFENYFDSLDGRILIIGLEEPEAHLQPHLQRQLISFLKNRLKAQRDENQLSTQLIVSTHSSNVLQQTKPIQLHFFKQDLKSQNLTTSCSNITAEDFETISKRLDLENWEKKFKKIQKLFDYLIQYFPECFFSRVVILVEGHLELGAFPVFGDKMGINFDKFGITVVRGVSKGELLYIQELFKAIEKPVILVEDKDTNDPSIELIFKEDRDNFSFSITTQEYAFEKEILSSIKLPHLYSGFSEFFVTKSLKKWLANTKGKINQSSLPPSAIQQFRQFTKFSEVMTFIQRNKGAEVKKFFRERAFEWLKDNKSHPLLSQMIARKIKNKYEIPPSYFCAIIKAYEFSKLYLKSQQIL